MLSGLANWCVAGFALRRSRSLCSAPSLSSYVQLLLRICRFFLTCRVSARKFFSLACFFHLQAIWVSLSSSSVSGLERSSWQSSKHGCITTVANSPLCRSTIQVEKVPGISRRRTHAGFRQPLSHPATQLQHQASLPLIVCSQKTCRPCGCARRSASQAVEPPKFPPTHN